MGSSDPLPARIEIRFGGLNFPTTGNGYLMCITNRDELRARRQTGADPASVAPTTHAPTSTHVDAAGPSAPRRHRRSGRRSRQARTKRRRAARVASQHDATTGEMAAAPMGEHSISGPRFPIGLRGATTAYVASANTDTATRRVHPGCHVPDVRDPSASTDEESSHGSASGLPPATSHGTRSLTSPACLTGDVPAVPRRHELLVWLLRQLQCRKLRSRAGVLRRTHQRPSKRRKCGRSWRRGGSPRPGNWTVPGCGAKRSPLLIAKGGRHQRTTGSSARA
jgi:hypothetical protein